MNDQHSNEDVPYMREMLYIFVTKHKNSNVIYSVCIHYIRINLI